jgi:hypothetical protein
MGGVSQSIANDFWTLTTYKPKSIILTLKNALGTVVASTLVKYAVFDNTEGNPYNYNWMTLTNKGVVTTTQDGVFEVLYTGNAIMGETVYIAIIHPVVSSTESMIWGVTVQ